MKQKKNKKKTQAALILLTDANFKNLPYCHQLHNFEFKKKKFPLLARIFLLKFSVVSFFTKG